MPRECKAEKEKCGAEILPTFSYSATECKIEECQETKTRKKSS